MSSPAPPMLPILTIKDVTTEYRLQGVLSSSPQTTVFRAVDPSSSTAVALKLISPADQTGKAARERFARTMEALRSLRLQGCPDLLDYGVTPDGSAFMVMELVHGVELGSYAGLPAGRTIPLLLRLLGVLEVLAAEQITHDNLRPDNVLVHKGRGGESIRLLGLGSSAFLAPQEGAAMPGQSRETDPFAAPELFAPWSACGQGWRSDLYSFAQLACQVLGARVISPGSDSPRVELAPRRGLGDAARLATALEVALQGDPAARQLSHGQLRDAFGTAMPPPPPGHSKRTGRVSVPADDATPAAAGEDRQREVAAVGIEPGDEKPEVAAEHRENDAMEWEPTAPDGPLPEVPLDGTSATPEPGSDTDEDLGDGFDDEHLSQMPTEAGTPVVPRTMQLPPSQLPVGPATGRAARSRSPKVVATVAGCAVLTALLVAVLLSLRGFQVGNGPTDSVAPPSPTVVMPSPTVPALPAIALRQLAAADKLLAAGDVEGARLALQLIPAEERAQLSAAQAVRLTELSGQIETAQVRSLAGDLKRGLERGSIAVLQQVVAALAELPGEQISAQTGLQEDLERARQALQVHRNLWAARRSGDQAAVLEQAARLIELLPEHSGSYNLREEAAAELERRAASALQAGNETLAAAHLAPIRLYWPERARNHRR